MLFLTGCLNYETELLPGDRFTVYRSLRKPSVERKEISECIVLDYDAEGNVVGIDIDNASRKIQLKELTISRLFSDIHAVA